MPPLGPIQAVSLADRAHQQLVAALLSGALPIDQPLVQDALAEQLGISRTPVREALLRMERQGLVRASGRSFIVPEVSPRDVHDLYGVREAIEGHAARLVVERGPQAVAQIAEALHELSGLPGDTGEAAYHLNRRAHRAVVEAADNQVLLEVFDDLWGRGAALRTWADYYAHSPHNVDVESDHTALLVALRTGSPECGQAAMVDHVREGVQRHGARTTAAITA